MIHRPARAAFRPRDGQPEPSSSSGHDRRSYTSGWDAISTRRRWPPADIVWLSEFHGGDEPFRGVAMAQFSRPKLGLRESRQIYGHHVPRFKHATAMCRQFKVADKIDARRAWAQIVPHPSGPMQKIGIVPREAQQTEDRLHHCLLHEIDKGEYLDG
jgi:hypothetical protein